MCQFFRSPMDRLHFRSLPCLQYLGFSRDPVVPERFTLKATTEYLTTYCHSARQANSLLLPQLLSSAYLFLYQTLNLLGTVATIRTNTPTPLPQTGGRWTPASGCRRGTAPPACLPNGTSHSRREGGEQLKPTGGMFHRWRKAGQRRWRRWKSLSRRNAHPSAAAAKGAWLPGAEFERGGGGQPPSHDPVGGGAG